MTKILKIFMIMIMLTALSGLLIACNTPSSEIISEYNAQNDGKTLSDDLKLALSLGGLDEECAAEVTRGFEAYCKEHKYFAIVAKPEKNATVQCIDFENWTAMQVDVIAAVPIDETQLVDIIAEAKDKEMIVAGFYKKIPGANFNYTLDEYDLGYMMGQNALKWIDEKLGGSANVLIVCNDNDASLETRGNGIKDALNEVSGVRIVASISADNKLDIKSQQKDALTTYMNINVIVCINDEYAIDILDVIHDLEINKEFKIDNENFYVGGAGYTDEAIKLMNENGSYFRSSVNLSPYEAGRQLAQMMAEVAVSGEAQDTLYFEPKSYWQNILNWNQSL